MDFSPKHITEFLREGLHSLSLRRLGWAFLLAWVFCVFYTSALSGAVSENSLDVTPYSLFYGVLPVGSSVVTLVAVVLLERRFGSPVAHDWLFIAAPACAAFATPLLLVASSTEVPIMVAYALGAVLTGVGSGLLWVMWGEYYARIGQENVEFLAPASAFFAALIAIVVSAMQGWVPVVIVSAMPLASGACLIGAWREADKGGIATDFPNTAAQIARKRAHGTARAELGRVFESMGRSCFGILVACLLICLEGGLFRQDNEAISVQAAFVVSIAFMIIVGISSISGPRRVSLAFLYRWMCPVLVVGYACIVLLGPANGLFVAYVVAVAARFAFCLITQMYFARYASRGLATPVQAYGLGWISVHLGDALGVFAISIANQGVASGVFSLEQVAVFASSLLVISTMFVLNDEKSFCEQGEAAVYTEQSFGLACEDCAENDECSPSEEDAAPAKSEMDEEAALDARVADLARERKLTPRETEVLGLLARGRSVPYIRDALVISRETAATHTKHIYAKLGVHSRQELIDLVLAQ